MKKLVLLATAAAMLAASSAGQAADFPMKAPLAPLPPPFSWTGFYLGGNIGGAWAHRNVTDTFGVNFSRTSDSVFIGGGQVGFNYQMGGFLLGVEADFDWAGNNNNNNNNNGVAVPGVVGLIRVSANDKWISTVAARFGLAFGQSLIYGKAGGGWVGASDFTITNVNTGASITAGNGRSNSGFLVGAGYE